MEGDVVRRDMKSNKRDKWRVFVNREIVCTLEMLERVNGDSITRLIYSDQII